MDSIADAAAIRRILAPILDAKELSLTDVLRRSGQAINLAGDIERRLIAARSRDEN